MMGSGAVDDGVAADYNPPGCRKSSWMYFRLKHLENLRKHGIDLADCEVIFDAPLATEEDDREAYGANSDCKAWGCFTLVAGAVARSRHRPGRGGGAVLAQAGRGDGDAGGGGGAAGGTDTRAVMAVFMEL
jgi:hypothetical protein